MNDPRELHGAIEATRPLTFAESFLMFVEDENNHQLSPYYHQLWRETSKLKLYGPVLVLPLLAVMAYHHGSWPLFALVSLVYMNMLQVWLALSTSRKLLRSGTMEELAAAGMTPGRLKDDIHFYVMFRCQCIMVVLLPVLVLGTLYLGYRDFFGLLGDPYFWVGLPGAAISFGVYIFLAGLVLDQMFLRYVKADVIRSTTASNLRELSGESMGCIVSVATIGFMGFVVLFLRLLFSGWVHKGVAVLILIGFLFLMLFLFVKLSNRRMKRVKATEEKDG